MLDGDESSLFIYCPWGQARDSQSTFPFSSIASLSLKKLKPFSANCVNVFTFFAGGNCQSYSRLCVHHQSVPHGMMLWSPSKSIPDAEIERVVGFPVSHIIDRDDRLFKQVSYSKELPEHQLAHVDYNQLYS